MVVLGYSHEKLVWSQTLESIVLALVWVKWFQFIVIFDEEVKQVLLWWREAIHRDLVKLSWESLFGLSSDFEFDDDGVHLKEMVAKLFHDVMELDFILTAKNL